MSSLERFEVVGMGPNRIEPGGGIIAEAGWNTTGTIEAAVQLKSTKVLKDAKVVVELRGFTETRWTGPKPMDVNDKSPVRVGRKFLQVVEVVRDKKEPLEPNE
ncbi:hypothetical protein HDU76_010486, partial [Blyttiomyces sp. JEL0837]